MNKTAFFYGTLMAPGVLYRVIYGTSNPSPLDHPSMKHLSIRPALLQNYCRHKVKYCDYPAIVPEEGSCVRGTVVSGLTSGDLWRLDIFEGDQYERGRVQVKVLEDIELNEESKSPITNGITNNVQAKIPFDDPNSTPNPPVNPQSASQTEEVEAETYIWFSSRTELEPEEWDFEEFKREKMKFWMGMEGSDDKDENTNGVQKDEGFDDVDRAVAELKSKEAQDGMGGRGVNGHIGKQLTEAQQKTLRD